MQWILRLGAAGMAFLFAASSLWAAGDDVSPGRPSGKAIVHAKSPSSGGTSELRKSAAEAGAQPQPFDRPVFLEPADPAVVDVLREAPAVPAGKNRAPPL